MVSVTWSRGLLVVCAIIVYISRSEAQVSLPFQCSFETDDLCGMRQRTDDQFDWTRHTGPTPSRPSGTGPYNATDGDYYIYIEASDHTNGERAIIETPPLRFIGVICLQFWYHMYTLNPPYMGRLVVFAESQGEGNPLFDVGGVNKGDQWIPEQITVTGFMSDDKIVFLNEERNAHQGDMALDMIDIQGGTCNDVTPPPTTTTTTTTTTPPPNECLADHECDQLCHNTHEGYFCSCRDSFLLADDKRHCIDCQDVYLKQLDASQAFTSLCPTIETYLNVPLTTCFINACADNVSVVTYASDVCTLKLCTGGDLQVERAPNSNGWNIYVLNTTWGGPRPEDASSFPLWQLLTGVFVGAAALGAIIAVVTVCVRKRISSGEGEGRAQYEYAEAIARHETTAENTERQPEGGVYDEVFATDVQTTRGPNDVRRHESTAENTGTQPEGHVYLEVSE